MYTWCIRFKFIMIISKNHISIWNMKILNVIIWYRKISGGAAHSQMKICMFVSIWLIVTKKSNRNKLPQITKNRPQLFIVAMPDHLIPTNANWKFRQWRCIVCRYLKAWNPLLCFARFIDIPYMQSNLTNFFFLSFLFISVRSAFEWITSVSTRPRNSIAPSFFKLIALALASNLFSPKQMNANWIQLS